MSFSSLEGYLLPRYFILSLYKPILFNLRKITILPLFRRWSTGTLHLVEVIDFKGFIGSPLKMMKNTFDFILKALFILKIF